MAVKKLIEVALPLEKINAESAREKSIRHGHPSTLHLWWARRPLSTARAVIWSSLVDDPSSHPEMFPTEEEQDRERRRLFSILERLVVWENINDTELFKLAKAEILKYNNGVLPEFLDPFSGGGAIPLEAQRLGLKAHAHDLNPVAVMINKSMIEIPSLFTGMPPVNPESRQLIGGKHRTERATCFTKDVEYYGNWLKKQAFKRIGHLYPQMDIPREQGGGKGTVIAWIWARNVKCPNPLCGCKAPLVRNFALSKKKGKEAYIEPIVEGKEIHYTVKLGKKFPDGTVKRTGATCIFCGQPIDFDYIRKEAKAGRMDVELIGMIGEGAKGRVFGAPTPEHILAAKVDIPENCPETNLPEKALGFRVQAYGMLQHKDLFSPRQLTALTTLSELVSEVQSEIEKDAVNAGLANDHVPLANGGSGALAYGQAVSVYLAFLVDQVANHSSTICSWNAPNTQMRNTFARQAIPMVWDYAECNVFSNSSGSYSNLHERLCKAFVSLGMEPVGQVKQFDAQSDPGYRNIMVSTDPPYYDNIGYADLSDYFYVWMRMALKDTYPDLFRTMLVPKAEELIATPFRFEGSSAAACEFFENGMYEAFTQVYKVASDDIPVTIYYAFKQSDSDAEDDENDSDNSSGASVSSGWETMLSAIIRAGFSITGTWPVRTEKPGRSVGIGTNALASSIVLVCRKRPLDAPQTTRRNLVSALRRELRPALKKLQDSNIAPVDLAQSAIGPGMGVFSKYRKVLDADGNSMSVRSALQVINEELDLYFNEQVGSMDTASRFCVDLYTQCAYNDIKYGEAEVLANAKGTSIPMMASHGILYAKAGIVHLIERNEMPEKVDTDEHNIWMLTQQLTRAMEKGGVNACAEIVFNIFGSNAESAKDLAYRLYTIADRKGWADEAYAYNNLVVAWPDIQTRAAELKAVVPEQLDLFSIGMLKKKD
jgi:putative DNA methylase